jgi:uncharacterized membrane protein YoaK (UPF0700 family)
MISKLPRWAWVGSVLLTIIAGTINAVGFLSFQHQGVTHLTGSTTLLGLAVASGSFSEVSHLLAVTGSFVVGCIISGALTQNSTLKLGRRYGVALAAESLLLICAVPLLEGGDYLGAYFASCACGLQNGIVSTYSGAVLRTTHVSGAFTDLGIFIGQRLRGVAVDRRRIWLCLLLIAAFFSGSCLGALAYSCFSYATLYFPAVAIGGVGLAYTIYRHRRGTAG